MPTVSESCDMDSKEHSVEIKKNHISYCKINSMKKRENDGYIINLYYSFHALKEI